MKLTKQRLKEIIKEEIQNLREARYQEITISLDDFYKVTKIFMSFYFYISFTNT